MGMPSKDKKEDISLNDFMEEFWSRFDNQDRKLDKNNWKMDSMSLKLERLDAPSRKLEKENKEEFGKIRNEIAVGLNELEGNMPGKVIEQIKPKITELEVQVKGDLRNVIVEEVEKVDIPKLIENEVNSALRRLEVVTDEEEEETRMG